VSVGVESAGVESAPALDWSAYFNALTLGLRCATRGRTVTEADVVAFAGLTGDYHPQHSDAEWARCSEFGQRIAHGLLVVSFAVGLLPLDPERVLALRRLTEVVFKRPVLLGDTIHVEAEIETLRPIDDRAGLVSCRCSIINQHGKLACRALVEVLWRTEPA
jgi:3-hydroxybutyryl-CoA dehydratase